MKLVLILGFLFCLILTTHSRPSNVCFQKIRRATHACMQNFQTNNLFESVKQVGRNEISHEEFEYRVQSVCPHWLNREVCDLNIDYSIDSYCLRNSEMRTIINAFKFVVASSAYMCENDGERFFDYVDNDGVYCSENTPEEQQCSSELKAHLAPDNTNQLFTNENMCEYIRGEKECSRYLEACDNKMVANISIGALEHVSPILGC